MLHLLYILAFTVLAVLAVSNMIRNLVRLGTEVQKPMRPANHAGAQRPVPHPELLNDSGDVINEPLLVMRSISINDDREQLNAIYEASSGSDEAQQEDT